MADPETNIITQNKGERFAHDHGNVALHGAKDEPPMEHRFAGEVLHSTPKPLMHMVCWSEEKNLNLEVAGRLTLAGDEKAPVQVVMHHQFDNELVQSHKVEPLDHALAVQTALARPIHHALQMRTPLQVRFCNPWHVASDYQMEIAIGNTRIISFRLTGATVATPQPCPDDDCPPPAGQPSTP